MTSLKYPYRLHNTRRRHLFLREKFATSQEHTTLSERRAHFAMQILRLQHYYLLPLFTRANTRQILTRPALFIQRLFASSTTNHRRVEMARLGHHQRLATVEADYKVCEQNKTKSL